MTRNLPPPRLKSPQKRSQNFSKFLKAMSSRVTSRNFTFGAFRLDTTRRLLTRAAGEAVPLTPKGFELLLLLVESEGRLLTKADFLREILLLEVYRQHLPTLLSSLR